jgi:hypothetical protein
MQPTRKELILAGLVMLAIPLLAEVAIRLSNVSFEPQLYIGSAERGWVLRPQSKGFVTNETRQYVSINGLGFHDKERAYRKPPDTIRIAILGNSWTEALQVPTEQNFTSVLERELRGRECFAGKHIEVLNFGVAGYSTGQELLTLRQEVWKYQPDLVIVGFYSARDVANNVKELNNAANPEQSPYFIYSGGNLKLDDSFRALPVLQPRELTLQKIRYQVSQHVRVLQSVSALQRFAKLRIASAEVRERAATVGLDNLEYDVYKPPAQLTMQRAWTVTESLLVAIRDESRAHGADFRIVTLATRPQVIPDLRKRAELMQQLGVENLSYADERIKALGRREGIPVTNLAPVLAEYAATNHVFLNGFNQKNLGTGHWNELGHRLAGEVIATDVCDAKKTRPIGATTGAQ